jgi:4-aminobutyrate aminotransferase-like enzyme
MFVPVGPSGEYTKIAPPLTITEEASREGIQVLEEALEEVFPKNVSATLEEAG